jgi:CBS domain-containing protein
MRVQEVMTRDVATLDATDTIRKAANVMRGRGIGCQPVTPRHTLITGHGDR